MLVGIYILNQNIDLTIINDLPYLKYALNNISIQYLIILVLIRFLLIYVSNFYQIHLSTKFLKDFRVFCFENINNVKQESFDIKKNEIINLFTTEFGSIMKIIQLRISTLAEISIILIAIFMIFEFINFYIIIIVCLIIIVLTLVFFLFRKFIYRLNELRLEISEKIVKSINEITYFIDYFKIYPLNGYKNQLHSNFILFSKNEKYKQSILMNIKPFAENIGLILLILFASILSPGAKNIELLVISTAVVYKFLPNLIKIFNLSNEFRANKPYYDKFVNIHDDFLKENLSQNDNSISNIKSLAIKNLKYKFEGTSKILFSNLNYEFKSFGLYSIVGPNGSGKSTLLKILSGINKKYQGDVLYNNINTKLLKSFSYSEKIFYIGDRPLIINDTVKNNIELFNTIKNNNFGKFFKEKELSSKISLYTLSQGEKIKLCLERLYTNKFQGIILIDEPTANLDIETKNILLNELKILKKNNFIFVTTHDQDIVKISESIIKIG